MLPGYGRATELPFPLLVSSSRFAETSHPGLGIFSLQGKFTKQTLNEIGTFLRYMETQNNVKVRAKFTLPMFPMNAPLLSLVHPEKFVLYCFGFFIFFRYL